MFKFQGIVKEAEGAADWVTPVALTAGISAAAFTPWGKLQKKLLSKLPSKYRVKMDSKYKWSDENLDAYNAAKRKRKAPKKKKVNMNKADMNKVFKSELKVNKGRGRTKKAFLQQLTTYV